MSTVSSLLKSSNNTNKFNPQEPWVVSFDSCISSNNTNKFNPQEPISTPPTKQKSSNNTNKFNPQEQKIANFSRFLVQIIQINSILKNMYV